jgi:ricin-type beta-trefoil lectin protein
MPLLKATAVALLVSCLIVSFGSRITHAAVLSVGGASVCGGAQLPGDDVRIILCLNNNNNPLSGGYLCADVAAANLTPNTPIIAWSCHAGQNQQFELVGFTIYALGGQRCVAATGITPGAPVVSISCVSTPLQAWYYNNGQFINVASTAFTAQSALCLDATNPAQLVVNNCNGSPGQNWQIK